jgi:hypothetical protein
MGAGRSRLVVKQNCDAKNKLKSCSRLALPRHDPADCGVVWPPRLTAQPRTALTPPHARAQHMPYWPTQQIHPQSPFEQPQADTQRKGHRRHNWRPGAPVSITSLTMDSDSLRTKGSQETLASLMQLDPSPIESPRLNTEKDLPPLPEHDDDLEPSIKPRRQSATGVGLSGSHGAIYYRTPLVNPPKTQFAR